MPLLHIAEAGKARVLELAGDAIDIGRSESNQVALQDPDISRKHCRIVRQNGAWSVRDLESQNGLEVNGVRVTESPLLDGDVIQVSQAVLTFYDRPGVGPSARRAPVTDRKLGELCLDKGLLSRAELEASLTAQQGTPLKLGEVLTRSGLISPGDLLSTLGEQLNTPCVELTRLAIPPGTLALFTRDRARIWRAVPIHHERDQQRLVVALADPSNFETIQEIEFYTRCRLDIVLATPQDISIVIEREYPASVAEADLLRTAMEESAQKAPVLAASAPTDDNETRALARLVTSILEEAIRQGASDVHIEPNREDVLVRFRVDGILVERRRLPKALQAPITNRLKILAKMDIAEKRVPQDGRHSYSLEGRQIDLRIASLPALHGEKIVLRMVNRALAKTAIDELGMEEELKAEVFQVLRKPEGMFLVTGPTGSGKTSTLYAALNHLRATERNLVTLEDPIELEFAGVTQTQVYDHPDFGFASGLRAILRQDPNIIMVGEIRDRETAQIAVQAGMTGHVVLTSLHTNSAPTAIPRLFDMGVEPYLVTASLVGVLAQRLVRVICPACRVLADPPVEVIKALMPGVDASAVKFYRGAGCPKCLNGYRGRTGIFELLVVDDELQRLIAREAQAPEIRFKARERGMSTMREDALRKALAGITTIEEVLRLTAAEV
ncbi:MAG: Flp pilus assembly complex ATPase component TadA [Planctomycetes bacterium]|nr:Flp pilus assembly complex ATPase component TadA [Planctomycetota bacterium]